MVNITENLFIEYTQTLNISQIKHKIGRIRLKFNKVEISYYLYCIFLATEQNKTLQNIHKNYFLKKYNTKYSTFANNIKFFSLLIDDFFVFTKKKYNINKTNTNIVDTTLIEEKQAKFITKKDWKNNRVTTRNQNKQTQYICGSKGLVFCNLLGQIYYAKLLNINISDQNILKDSAIYSNHLSKYLLADRGFNNKNAKQRLLYFDCELISPNHYKTVEKTGEYFELDWYKKIYKKRWKIETIFKLVKQNQADFKLDLKGKYSQELKKAKFLITIISYNLSTL
jgi:Transposase DDE domain